mmetsp:Transcript_42588/g.76544  ORF Transcript_42588/g.76544 Transcript_42588/m.76544 type:complete len:400 (-) Transcript_42588:462-1661(-)
MFGSFLLGTPTTIRGFARRTMSSRSLKVRLQLTLFGVAPSFQTAKQTTTNSGPLGRQTVTYSFRDTLKKMYALASWLLFKSSSLKVMWLVSTPGPAAVKQTSSPFQAAMLERARPMVMKQKPSLADGMGSISFCPAESFCGWSGLGTAGVLISPAGSATRSTMVALAVPPLSHIVRSPYRPPLRSSSPIRFDINMAPVAPIGWPLAMAPPLTFTFERSPPVMARAQAKGTDENASFTSMRSRSSIFKPAFANAWWVAGTGPSSINTGSMPARPKETTRALGLRPSFCRPRSLQTIIAAAPSQIWDAAAAVSTPFFKIGLSFPRVSMLVLGRIPSSTVCCSLGAGAFEMPSWLLQGMGTISGNRPAFDAASASAWLRAANSSASLRVMLYFFATSSAPTN